MQETVYARAGGAEDSGAVAHGASVSSVLVAGFSRRGLALRSVIACCLVFALLVGQGHVFLTQAVIFATTHLTAFMMHHDHLHDVSHDSCSLAWNRRF